MTTTTIIIAIEVVMTLLKLLKRMEVNVATNITPPFYITKN